MVEYSKIYGVGSLDRQKLKRNTSGRLGCGGRKSKRLEERETITSKAA